jgi:hypothetical protein
MLEIWATSNGGLWCMKSLEDPNTNTETNMEKLWKQKSPNKQREQKKKHTHTHTMGHRGWGWEPAVTARVVHAPAWESLSLAMNDAFDQKPPTAEAGEGGEEK